MNEFLRIISIDPGSVNLGLCVADVSANTFKPVNIITDNVQPPKLPLVDFYANMDVDNTEYKLAALGNFCYRIFTEQGPHILALESSFYNVKRPSAFKSLLNTVSYIEHAFYRFNPFGIVLEFSPHEIKRNINSKGHKKEDVKEALINMPEIISAMNKPIEECTEHEIDAISVLISACGETRKQNGLKLWLNRA